MPVFERYRIDRYKEILTNQPAGNVPDGGFSSYNLDDPSITPNGTGDFLGVIKTVVLLGEIYKETIDTRNMSFTEFNNLTQQQFDDYVSQGLILLNRQTNGQPQRIGWVEMGRSYASFYYQSCQGGKRPVSEHYFDINEFIFDNKTVIGEGSEIEPTEALTPIGNFDPNIATNLGVLRPRFEPLNLTDYIKFAMVGSITNSSGETVRINDLSLTDQTRPTQVSLLMANKSDHFDNQFATEVSPGKWGMIRRTISESLKPGVHVVYPQLGFSVQQNPYSMDFSISEGQCLQTTVITTNGGAVRTGGDMTTFTPEMGGPMKPPTLLDSGLNDGAQIIMVGRPNKEIQPGTYDKDLSVSRDFNTEPCFKFIHDFPNSLKKKMKIIGNTIKPSELNAKISEKISSKGANLLGIGYQAARFSYQMKNLMFGRIPYVNSPVPDILDSFDIPRGSIRKEINPDTGCMEFTYIGTPVRDYIGPKISTPAEIEFERGDEAGFDENWLLDVIDRRVYSGSPSELLSTKEWYRRLFQNRLKAGGASFQSKVDTTGGAMGPGQALSVLVNENERLYPFYFHASDQQWKNGVAGTKTIRLSNRGASRIIITDYTPRGNANFINIGLLNALPLVLNPDEYVDVDIDYVPVTEGLQTWKGKNDPFPALLTDVYPLNYIKIDFEVWVRVAGIGYVLLSDIKTTPGVGPFRFKGQPNQNEQRLATTLQIKNRNKDYSILSVEVPVGT